jgi:DNA (cytosine-5)-methyltransferase 1
MMRHLDLFSGIGGFALACRMVGGIETVAFCEREPYAQKVLKKHWPDVPICNDIHEMKGNEYGTIDLITGGFPCQPYSLAGERRGNEDDRALWPQMLRVISEARPAWVLGENVPGIITLALDGVLADLEGEGYACQSLCIPACGVDARHRRERVWIVACAGRTGQQERDIAAISKGSGYGAGGCNEMVRDSAGEGLPDWTSGEMGQPCPLTEFERPSGREIERDIRGVAHGVSNRVDRLRGLGNAIVPQVAAEIIRCMKQADAIYS